MLGPRPPDCTGIQQLAESTPNYTVDRRDLLAKLNSVRGTFVQRSCR